MAGGTLAPSNMKTKLLLTSTLFLVRKISKKKLVKKDHDYYREYAYCQREMSGISKIEC